MRKLASNEKVLFLALCGAVFLALNLLSLKVFLNISEGVQSNIATMRTKFSEGQASIAMAEALIPATSWIKQHPLPIWNDDQASSELLKNERSQAEQNGLKIIEENLLPPHTTPDADSVSVQTKLSGPLEGLVKFLFALQNPTAWRAINKFTMKSDNEPSKVVVDLEIKQFFKNR